jgi:hypothetical protein
LNILELGYRLVFGIRNNDNEFLQLITKVMDWFDKNFNCTFCVSSRSCIRLAITSFAMKIRVECVEVKCIERILAIVRKKEGGKGLQIRSTPPINCSTPAINIILFL